MLKWKYNDVRLFSIEPVKKTNVPSIIYIYIHTYIHSSGWIRTIRLANQYVLSSVIYIYMFLYYIYVFIHIQRNRIKYWRNFFFVIVCRHKKQFRNSQRWEKHRQKIKIFADRFSRIRSFFFLQLFLLTSFVVLDPGAFHANKTKQTNNLYFGHTPYKNAHNKIQTKNLCPMICR